MATPNKVRYNKFGDDAQEFLVKCEGRTDGKDNDAFKDFFHEATRGEVGEMLNDLSKITEPTSGQTTKFDNAAEYVCDFLLKDKSKLFYSMPKIEKRELKYEAENVFDYDKKETYKHYYENKLFELRLSEIMSFPIKKLMDEVIPTLKKQKQHELDQFFLNCVIAKAQKWLEDWNENGAKRQALQEKMELKEKIDYARNKLENAHEKMEKEVWENGITAYEKQLAKIQKKIDDKEWEKTEVEIELIETQELEEEYQHEKQAIHEQLVQANIKKQELNKRKKRVKI